MQDTRLLGRLINDGLMEKFTSSDGILRIRPTPLGARASGREALAKALEACKEGRHEPFEKHPCACGSS